MSGVKNEGSPSSQRSILLVVVGIYCSLVGLMTLVQVPMSGTPALIAASLHLSIVVVVLSIHSFSKRGKFRLAENLANVLTVVFVVLLALLLFASISEGHSEFFLFFVLSFGVFCTARVAYELKRQRLTGKSARPDGAIRETDVHKKE